LAERSGETPVWFKTRVLFVTVCGYSGAGLELGGISDDCLEWKFWIVRLNKRICASIILKKKYNERGKW